jgi:hypothetical protein
MSAPNFPVTESNDPPKKRGRTKKITVSREEYLKDYMKVYYKNHPEKFVTKMAVCEICNRKYETCHIKRHVVTRKHILALEQQKSSDPVSSA